MWCYRVFQQRAKTSILVDKHSKKPLLLDVGYNWRGRPYSQGGEPDASMIEGVPPYNISRREFLCVPIVVSALAQPTATLQGQAARCGITYGGAVAFDHLQGQDLRSATLREMHMIVPENDLRWATLRPSSTRYDFTNADYLMCFARLHGKKMRGHCLARHEHLPDWFAAVVKSRNAYQMLSAHITTVVRWFAGHMPSWELVYEQVET
jgi:GH35 family endo-1,4-beta-xylanase